MAKGISGEQLEYLGSLRCEQNKKGADIFIGAFASLIVKHYTIL
jgi:hypothetical protein